MFVPICTMFRDIDKMKLSHLSEVQIMISLAAEANY